MSWTFWIDFLIVSSLTLQIENRLIARQKKHIHPLLSSHPNVTARAIKRDESRRGLKIGLELKIPTTEQSNAIEELKKEILKTLDESPKADSVKKVLQEELKPQKLLLKPTFECEQWDSKTRTCWLNRNIGDTVTFSLSSGIKGSHKRPDIVWKKQLALKDSSHTTEYILDPKTPSRNTVIGRRGYELRISPITELDLDENRFSASFAGNPDSTHAQVNFKIRIVPEDLGFVYIGETLDLSIDSYVALPLQSMSFYWYTEKEGEFWTLPSNMRVSSNGLSLRISELRQDQEGIVTCTVYTNKDVHATKKRFLIKKPESKDILHTFKDPGGMYEDKKVKRQMKIAQKPKPNNPRKPKHHQNIKKTKNGMMRSQRQVDQANFGGDQYSIVKQDSYGADQRLKPYGQNSENDEINSIEQDSNENSPEGMNVSFGNSTDMDTVINIDMDKDKYKADDEVSKLISYCTRDVQCSNHASCIRKNLSKEGFCRCLSGFYGPGIFCRVEM